MRLVPIALSLGVTLLPVMASAQDSAPARGVFKTGEELFAACTASDAATIDSCDWFLMGAQDMATYYQDTDQVETSFCLPAGTNAEALRKLVVDRLRANPNTRRYSAVSGFLNALNEAYPGPCKA